MSQAKIPGDDSRKVALLEISCCESVIDLQGREGRRCSFRASQAVAMRPARAQYEGHPRHTPGHTSREPLKMSERLDKGEVSNDGGPSINNEMSKEKKEMETGE